MPNEPSRQTREPQVAEVSFIGQLDYLDGEWMIVIPGAVLRRLRLTSGAWVHVVVHPWRTVDERVRDAAIALFRNAPAAWAWLVAPQVAFGGRRPIDIIQDEAGVQQVLNLIEVIRHGGVA